VGRLSAFVLVVAAGVARAAQPEVTSLMEDYWRAYSRSDFKAAATYLDPRDLGALQSGLLPLFLEASESKNVNVVPLVKAFFAGIPADRREDMTGPEVFAGMNYMMRDVLPAAYEALGKTRIRVDKVEAGDDGTAVVEYTVQLPDGEAVDRERANLHEGRWYLRTKDSPAVTIERFRMLLGLDFETGPEVKLSPPAIES
jgi:hypothetical protein